MNEYYPLLFVGAIIGVITLVMVLAFIFMKDKKTSFGFERNMKDSEILRRLMKYTKPYLSSFALVLLVMLISIAYDIISPILVGDAEEMVAGNFEMSSLLRLVMMYFAILLVSQVSSYVQAVVLQKTGQRIISNIREDLFEHIERLSHNQLNHIPVGTLVTRVSNDTNAISMMFTNLLVNFVKNIFVIAGVLVAMLLLNYELTLMVLCFVPFLILFTIIFRKFTRRAFRHVKDGTTAINVFLSENLSGIKITQIFNAKEKKLGEFRKLNNALYKARRERSYVFSIFRPIVYMLYITSIMILFYLGGKGCIQNTSFMGQVITGGTLVSFYMYISKFFNPIQNLAEQFNWLQSAFASAEKIFAVMDTVPEIEIETYEDKPSEPVNYDAGKKLPADFAEDREAYETFKGEIEFSHVWFAYEGEEWVLKDVSFHVNPGDTVAFVGATGSGKTTILSLVCRNYDIQKGQILIDNKDIKSYPVRELRKHFGQMLQDVFLFAGTVRSNITLRNEAFTDSQIMEACKYVNADKFIKRLPKGLDEEVRERGNNFSAGQRQLLSFARTIIHKPEVMILDEATANIDTETEILIQDSLERMMNIGTMLVVAHRLSTIKNANVIYVISNGRIVESGGHDELIQKGGAYYELYRLQQYKKLHGIDDSEDTHEKTV